MPAAVMTFEGLGQGYGVLFFDSGLLTSPMTSDMVKVHVSRYGSVDFNT